MEMTLSLQPTISPFDILAGAGALTEAGRVDPSREEELAPLAARLGEIAFLEGLVARHPNLRERLVVAKKTIEGVELCDPQRFSQAERREVISLLLDNGKVDQANRLAITVADRRQISASIGGFNEYSRLVGQSRKGRIEAITYLLSRQSTVSISRSTYKKVLTWAAREPGLLVKVLEKFVSLRQKEQTTFYNNSWPHSAAEWGVAGILDYRDQLSFAEYFGLAKAAYENLSHSLAGRIDSCGRPKNQTRQPRDAFAVLRSENIASHPLARELEAVFWVLRLSRATEWVSEVEEFTKQNPNQHLTMLEAIEESGWKYSNGPIIELMWWLIKNTPAWRLAYFQRCQSRQRGGGAATLRAFLIDEDPILRVIWLVITKNLIEARHVEKSYGLVPLIDALTGVALSEDEQRAYTVLMSLYEAK